MTTDNQQFQTITPKCTQGEFAGWVLSNLTSGFVNMIGPYYYQSDENGSTRVAFKAGAQHLNGGGSVHGGCLLTLADTAMFIFARSQLKDSHCVTLQLDSQFISRALEGDIIIASGEVVKAGASIIFLRGQLHARSNGHEDRLVLSFSGTLKRIKPRHQNQA